MEKGIGKEKTEYRFWAEMLIVIQSLVYGFGDPISKIAFDIVPVYSMMTVRYSIAFVFCIVIFGLYKYLQINKKVTLKKFISDAFKFLLPIICAVLMSSILLVPTFMTLLSGRDGSNVSINIME